MTITPFAILISAQYSVHRKRLSRLMKPSSRLTPNVPTSVRFRTASRTPSVTCRTLPRTSPQPVVVSRIPTTPPRPPTSASSRSCSKPVPRFSPRPTSCHRQSSACCVNPAQHPPRKGWDSKQKARKYSGLFRAPFVGWGLPPTVFTQTSLQCCLQTESARSTNPARLHRPGAGAVLSRLAARQISDAAAFPAYRPGLPNGLLCGLLPGPLLSTAQTSCLHDWLTWAVTPVVCGLRQDQR